jgi:DNA polymerase
MGKMDRHEPIPERTHALSELYRDYRDRRDELSDLEGTLVIGEGSHRPYAVLVGEAPGRQENALGRPFIGPTGRVLRNALAYRHINAAHLWITNAVKIWPRDPDGATRTPDDHEVTASAEYLMRELSIIAQDGREMPYRAAPLLVTLGRTALTAVTGTMFRKVNLTEAHGKALQISVPPHVMGASTWDLFPTIHPSALRSAEMREIWKKDWNAIDRLLKKRYEEGVYKNARAS